MDLLLYTKRNPARTAVFAVIVAIAVAGTIVVSSIFAAFGDTRQAMLAGGKRWVTVNSTAEISATELTTQLQAAHIRHGAIYNAEVYVLGYPLFGAAVAGFPVYSVNSADMEEIVRQYQLQLSSGKWPAAPREIALPESMMKALKLNIGDVLEEGHPYLTTGRYAVVGSIATTPWMGIAYPIPGGNGTHTLIVTGPEPSLLEVAVSRMYAADVRVNINGPTRIGNRFRDSYKSYFWLTSGLSVLMALVVAVTLTLLSSQELKNRRSELALLGIIGYQAPFLYLKVLLEYALNAVAGWLVGVVVGWLLVTLLALLCFYPNGMVVTISLSRIWPSFAIPMIMASANSWLISSTLRRDPVLILDAQGTDR